MKLRFRWQFVGDWLWYLERINNDELDRWCTRNVWPWQWNGGEQMEKINRVLTYATKGETHGTPVNIEEQDSVE